MRKFSFPPGEPHLSAYLATPVRKESQTYTRSDVVTVENSVVDIKVTLIDFSGADRVYIACGYTDFAVG